MNRRHFLSAIATTAASPQQPSPPNVLLIMCDQLNPTVLSAYGGPVSTPHIDRLAREGVLFRNATCPTPFCSPSRASMITGQYPHTHGIVHNLMRVDYPAAPGPATEQGITESDVTYDRILHEAGYRTHHYGKWHLSGDDLPYHPDRYAEHRQYAVEMKPVFDSVRQRPRNEWMNWYGWILPVRVAPDYAASFSGNETFRKGTLTDFILKFGKLEFAEQDVFDVRVADRTVQALKADDNRPFSITCSFNWPHDPNVIHAPRYDAEDPRKIELPATMHTREARFDKDLSRQMVAERTDTRIREFLRIYYASVRFLDHQVGRILQALDASGKSRNTIVVFTSDHGDMTGHHGMIWKSTQAFYDEVARVPLIVRWPGTLRAGKTDAAASLVDLPPTLLGLTRRSVPAQMEGVSLAPVLRGVSSAREQYAYRCSERVQQSPARTRSIAPETPGEFMIRGGGWKYAVYSDGEEFLYDLRKDSGETRNLAGYRAARATKSEMRRRLAAWLNDTSYRGRRL